MPPVEVDPRIEFDAQVARSLQIVCDASDADDQPKRDYTPEELDTLFFALGTALVQLAKVPGGKEAKDRHVANLRAELKRRGRQDLIEDAERG